MSCTCTGLAHAAQGRNGGRTASGSPQPRCAYALLLLTALALLPACSQTRYVTRLGFPYGGRPQWLENPGSFYPYKPPGLVYAIGIAEPDDSEARQMSRAKQAARQELARNTRTKVQGQIKSLSVYQNQIRRGADGRAEQQQRLDETFSSLTRCTFNEVLERSRTDAICRDTSTGRLYVLMSLVLPDLRKLEAAPGKPPKWVREMEDIRRREKWTKDQIAWMQAERKHMLELAELLPKLTEYIPKYGPPLYPSDTRPGISFSDWDESQLLSAAPDGARRRANTFKHHLRRGLIKSNTIGLVERGWREITTRLIELQLVKHNPDKVRRLLGQMVDYRFSIKATLWSDEAQAAGAPAVAAVDLTLWDVDTTRALDTALVMLGPTQHLGDKAREICQSFEQAVRDRQAERKAGM